MSSLPVSSEAETGLAMLAMLKRLEWAGERDPWAAFNVCPVCFSNEHTGHSKGCELAALIAATAIKFQPSSTTGTESHD